MTPSLWFQTVKGGISETRIEKRIVITGDADIDHDQVGRLRALWAREGSAGRKIDGCRSRLARRLCQLHLQRAPSATLALNREGQQESDLRGLWGGGRRLGKQGNEMERTRALGSETWVQILVLTID